MPAIILNGQRREFPEGTAILSACRSLGIDVPTLCHDERLAPTGGCRLCVVEIEGWNHHPSACNTVVHDGMQIRTHTSAVEQHRRTLLQLLADGYPADAVTAAPDKEFHRWLIHYQITPRGRPDSDADSAHRQPPFRDTTHPYLRADFAQCITCQRCVRICDEVQGRFVWRAWNRGDATRILPGNSPTLLDSDCVSCGACVDTCPTGALEDQSVHHRGRPTAWTQTTCPYCGTGCEMSVGTRAGQIVQVLPVRSAAVSRGHLCVKGRYAFDYNHAADRVTAPMIRDATGWRKVSWDEAVDFVAHGLGEIVRRSGPDSLGILGSARGTNEENYVAQKFARMVLGTNNVDACARVCHAPSASALNSMLGTGAATNSFADIEHARAVLLCGTNPTENHPIVGARILQAVQRGAQLIVIDPREIELARFATVHLAVRPGTNVLLLNALAAVIVEEKLYDAPTVEHRVAGWAAFREFIRDFTPESVAEVCSVPAEAIRRAARIYATEAPAMCFHGLGLTEHAQGTEGVMCLVNLALLTGNLGRAGAGVNPLRGQNNVQGSAHMGCEPDHLTGYTPLELGRAQFEAIWQAPIPHRRGLNLMQMMDAAAAGQLQALWAIGYDIALTQPNTSATRAALGRLKLVIVQDLFLTELAREFGHVFLPACSSFEKDGTFMNSERRVQRVSAALPPAGQSKSDWEIISAVAAAMDFPRAFAFSSAEAIWNEVRSLWPAGAGISYARLESGGLQWPCPTEDHPGTPILHVDCFAHGQRAPLQCIAHRASHEVVSAEFPFLLTTGRTLYAFNAGTMTGRTPNRQLRQADTLDMAPVDAERLRWRAGDQIRVQSRHGEALLPLRIDPRLRTGDLFATFHTVEAALNQLTSPYQDPLTRTPEYKRVAVRLTRETIVESEPASAVGVP